jgi:hypothetical protein
VRTLARRLGGIGLLAAAASLVLSCMQTGVDGTLHVQNGSTLPVSLVINARTIAVIDAGAGPKDFELGQLGEPPLDVALLSPTGRVLLSMRVSSHAVSSTVGVDGEVALRGTAARVDLSCGRLDLWVGPPLAGPAPGAGTPGDCAP